MTTAFPGWLLTIWRDPEMIWDATPICWRGRRQACSDAATRTCLSMKVLPGMALRQTTGFVESLLRLVGLDRAVPDFSALSRRRKTLAVNMPYRGTRAPLHLRIEAAIGSGPIARGTKVASGPPASMTAPNGGSGARFASGSRSNCPGRPAPPSACAPSSRFIAASTRRCNCRAVESVGTAKQSPDTSPAA